MRVLTFSKYFPAKHPKAGRPTFFVEKIFSALTHIIPSPTITPDFNWAQFQDCDLPKYHTIRAGNRWKVGDKFSARVWSGAPYRSKQTEFAQIEVKDAIPFQIDYAGYWLNDKYLEYEQLIQVAKNDGLSPLEFIDWFEIHPKKQALGFTGQVICWKPGLYNL